jgi:hypothetical protein
LAADSQTIDEDNTATGNVLANDSDVDDTLTVATFTVNGDAATYSGGDTAAIAGIGTVQIQTDGSYTFTPAANWNGDMPQVTYTTNTGSSSTLDVHVNPVNDPAVITGDTSYTGNAGDTATGDMDATDADGLTDGTYFSVTTAAANGTAAIDAATGVWTFTPSDPHWSGSDSFTVTVTDDQGGTTTQVVNIILAPHANQPPVIGGGGGDAGSGPGGDSGSAEPDPAPKPPPEQILPPVQVVPPSAGASDPPILGPSKPSPPPGSNYHSSIASMDVSDLAMPDTRSSNMAATLRYLLGGPVAHKTVRAGQNIDTVFSSQAMSQTLDHIQQNLDLSLAANARKGKMLIGMVTGLGVSVFAGYVIWALRGTSLLFGAISAMPMWRCFDPLPVLLGGDEERREEEEEAMTPEAEDAEDNVSELLGIEQMDSSRQVVIPEETALI